MPSGFTHMMISRMAWDRLPQDYQDKIKLILRNKVGFFLLGSVAPDIPYILGESVMKSQVKYANWFHYEQTDQIPKRAFQRIQQMQKNDENRDLVNSLYAFFIGYCSHVVGDGVTHPFVRDKVGEYNKDGVRDLHRKLEMRLDVYLCNQIFNTNLNNTEIQDELTDVDVDNEIKNQVFDMFGELIQEVYGDRPDTKMINKWYQSTHLAFDASANEFPLWYKDKVGGIGYSHFDYPTIQEQENCDCLLEMPIDADEHGLAGNFSGNAQVYFFQNIIPRFLEVFPPIICDSYRICFEDQSINKIDFPPINLDNGRHLDNQSLSETPYYWR